MQLMRAKYGHGATHISMVAIKQAILLLLYTNNVSCASRQILKQSFYLDLNYREGGIQEKMHLHFKSERIY